MNQPYGNHQNEVYLGGLGGETPPFPVSVDELERLAYEAMAPEARDYVEGGAGSETTVGFNRRAFDRRRIVPRVLRDVSARDLRVTVCGTELPAPVMLAPVGVQEIVHPEAEVASARGAASLGVPMVHSTSASRSIEEVAEAMGEVPRWFQLYWPSDRDLARSFLKRAEAAGYSAIVVTLDTHTLAWRPRDLARGYLPFLRGMGIGNYTTDPVFRNSLEAPPEEDLVSAVLRWSQVFADPSLTWGDLSWLRDATDLPILLKGVLHPDDAREAVVRGVDGIVVSNHGGRQMDGGIAALDALPAIAETVSEDVPLLFDSGIRTGSDVVKALALGASAVLVGRLYLWGLALGGADGVAHVLRNLMAEIDLTLALAGYTHPEDVGRDALAQAPDAR